MQKSTNYGLNLPDLADQFNLNHWNENTEKLDLELKKETDSRINNDNQLQSNINNSVSTLRNEISTAETNAKNLENATGVLPIAKGGTGKTTPKGAQNALLSDMQTETTEMDDTTEFVMKYGTPTDTKGAIFKRSAPLVWEYIKSKISSLLGLTATQYNGNAKTATQATQDGNGKNIANTYATKTETEKVKWLKSVTNESNNTKYYVVKNIKEPLQIMGSITRVDTICSVFNFSVTNYIKIETRIVGVWNNSAMYGQTWEILPFRVYYQSDGTCNLWVEIPSYSSMKIVLSSYSGTDYNFQESAFDDTGILCPNLMSITATDAYNAYRGMVHTCSTDASTVAKTVSVTGFTLTTGACIRVLFTNGNSVATPTLNVNNTGAKEIRVKQGSEYVPLSAENGALGMGAYGWQSNTLLELWYSGTYWIVNENSIVKESITDTAGTASYRVFINGKKEIWGDLYISNNIAVNTLKTEVLYTDLNTDNLTHSVNVNVNVTNTLLVAYGNFVHRTTNLGILFYYRNVGNEATSAVQYLTGRAEGY